MIKITIGILSFYSLLFVFTSCKREENYTPEITNITALNHSDQTNILPLGGSMSVDFDVKVRSGAKLSYYHLEIHDHPKSGQIADEYKIIDDSFFDEPSFTGLLNAHVHQHIYIPDTANLGSYHVVVVVVDMDGNSANTEELETHITVVE